MTDHARVEKDVTRVRKRLNRWLQDLPDADERYLTWQALTLNAARDRLGKVNQQATLSFLLIEAIGLARGLGLNPSEMLRAVADDLEDE